MKFSIQLITFVAIVSNAIAFTGDTSSLYRNQIRNRSTLYMGGATAYATTRPGKQEKIDKVQNLLSSSQMIFSVMPTSLTVKETGELRNALPEGTTMSVVKNTLMGRAIQGTDYENATPLLKGANMWFFIEEDIGGTIKAVKTFTKDAGKKETHGFLGGLIDGTVIDSAGVEQIATMPSKQELIARIAGGIKAVPTKVARVVKAPGTKMARAIKLASETLEES
jgi:large subunit ribosomal protein L10